MISDDSEEFFPSRTRAHTGKLAHLSADEHLRRRPGITAATAGCAFFRCGLLGRAVLPFPEKASGSKAPAGR